MPIKLNGATSGSIELDVPAAVGSDLQLTLPATAGEVVVKDGSGNVGIGTSSPNAKLQVNSGDLNIVARPSSTETGIFFRNPADTATYAKIGYTNTTGNLVLGTTNTYSTVFVSNDTERLRILPTGGLTFNGDTATANALDDYEEGTFIPSIGGSGVVGTFTGSSYGIYTKIGRQVSIGLRFENFSLTGATGTVKIMGLPFPGSGSQAYSTATVPMIYGIGFATDRIQSFYHGTSDASMNGIQSRNGNVWTSWDVSNFLGSAKYLQLSSTYQTT